MGNGARDLLWAAPRSLPHLRCSPASFSLAARIRRASPAASRLRACSASASRLRSAATPAPRRRALSTRRRCSCTASASPSGSGRCCRSLASLRRRRRPAPALARFSRVIPLPLVLLVATGVWLAVMQLGRVDALWTTSYGQVLACKLAAVAALLGLGAANRYWLVPRLQAGGARGRPAARHVDLVRARASRWRSWRWWRYGASRRRRARWRATRRSRSISMATRRWPRSRSSAAAGRAARANMLVLDGAFRRSPPRRSRSCSPIPPPASSPCDGAPSHAGESNWRIDDLRVPVAGRWNVRVEILVSDFDKVTVEDSVALPRVP